jgi:hypothetical protein
MDQQTDYEKFKRLVMRLCVTFDKFASDELLETWWKALRREDYSRIERNIENFIVKADDKTKFPRPGQFAGIAASDAHAEYQTRESIRHWDSFIHTHPTTGPVRLRMHQASRIMAECHESTPQYAEALEQYLACEKQLGPNGRFSADA